MPTLKREQAIGARCELGRFRSQQLAALHHATSHSDFAGSLDGKGQRGTARGERERRGKRGKLRALNSGAQAQITHREARVLAPFAISHATRRATHGVVCHAHGVVGTPVVNSERISAPIERGGAGSGECPVAARCHLPLARVRPGRLPRRAWPRGLHGGFQRRDRNDWLKVAVVNRLPHGALHKLWLARDLQVLRAGIRCAGEYVALEQQECLAW